MSKLSNETKNFLKKNIMHNIFTNILKEQDAGYNSFVSNPKYYAHKLLIPCEKYGHEDAEGLLDEVEENYYTLKHIVESAISMEVEK